MVIADRSSLVQLKLPLVVPRWVVPRRVVDQQAELDSTAWADLVTDRPKALVVLAIQATSKAWVDLAIQATGKALVVLATGKAWVVLAIQATSKAWVDLEEAANTDLAVDTDLGEAVGIAGEDTNLEEDTVQEVEADTTLVAASIAEEEATWVKLVELEQITVVEATVRLQLRLLDMPLVAIQEPFMYSLQLPDKTVQEATADTSPMDHLGQSEQTIARKTNFGILCAYPHSSFYSL